MIAWFGNILLYSFFECQENSAEVKVDEFKSIDVSFSDLTEIYRVLNTVDPNIYQIIARDHDQNVLLILTWDFKKNMEVG